MKNTAKNNITSILHRSIATLLLLSQLLTSCGIDASILPSSQPQAPIHSTAEEPLATPHTSQSHASTKSDNNFEIHTSTIEGTHLIFTYDGSEKQSFSEVALTPSLRGAVGDEATHGEC